MNIIKSNFSFYTILIVSLFLSFASCASDSSDDDSQGQFRDISTKLAALSARQRVTEARLGGVVRFLNCFCCCFPCYDVGQFADLSANTVEPPLQITIPKREGSL